MLPPVAPGAAADTSPPKPAAVYALSPRTNTIDVSSKDFRQQQLLQQQQQYGKRCPSQGVLAQEEEGGRGEEGDEEEEDQRQRRFGPMDYEASAILLECRTRPVVTPHAAVNKRRTVVA